MVEIPPMHCVSCGLKAGYNRVVVDEIRTEELGGFCFRCERNRYGTALTDGRWAEDDTCALCARDGHIALPEWEPELSDTHDRLVISNKYRITADTVRLCDEHFETLSRSYSAAGESTSDQEARRNVR